jgi:hypothetical protein
LARSIFKTVLTPIKTGFSEDAGAQFVKLKGYRINQHYTDALIAMRLGMSQLPASADHIDSLINIKRPPIIDDLLI